MQQQKVKISASGQDIGGSLLFPQRIGFSGTPSDLLPIDLGRCGYERGSDGTQIAILTNPEVVTVQSAPPNWSVESLLAGVATAEPHYHALIDVGALVTGLSNKGVAEHLLSHLGAWCEGCVFLDEQDEKMARLFAEANPNPNPSPNPNPDPNPNPNPNPNQIMIKATGRAVRLSQCGIAEEARFTFYDQVHTTGMDIHHAFSAHAVLTLGKDMVFRDLAQAAFRMRGIGAGQRLTIVVIPEVQQLMRRQLEAAGGAAAAAGSPQQQITAWLVINAMRSESVQANQLASQNLADIWRQNAWQDLLRCASTFGMSEDDRHLHVTELLGDAFFSPTMGTCSGAQLQRKGYLCLYFDDGSAAKSNMVKRLLKWMHGRYVPSGMIEIVFVPEVAAASPDRVTHVYGDLPLLCIPQSHVLRRQKLRELFDIKNSEECLLILDDERRVVTRKVRARLR